MDASRRSRGPASAPRLARSASIRTGDEDASNDEDAALDARALAAAVDEDDGYRSSPMMITTRILLGVVLQALKTVGTALALGVSIVNCVVPAFAVEWLSRRAFDVGYVAYTSRVGRWAHLRMIQSLRDEPAHAKAGTPLVAGGGVVVQIPFMNDNYSYLVVDADTREACAIDPADPERAVDAARRCGAKLTTVLTTHKHHDHAGGNARVRAMMALEENGSVDVEVYGHAMDKCHGTTREVKDGDVVRVGARLRFLVIHVPCHTLGHVVYALLGDEREDGTDGPTLANAKAMFTGDAIINGGVGAFFHGNANDCYENLHVRLAPTPDDCLIFSGHEYMETNLRFAKAIDVDDQITANCFFAIRLHRHQDAGTMPSSLRVERRLNPYFRCRDRDYLKTLLASKRRLLNRKKRPWWHRYCGPNKQALEVQRDRKVDTCALADIIDANGRGGHGEASREEAVEGIRFLRGLMGDVMETSDVRFGDDAENKAFREYVQIARATGTTHIVVSELVSAA